jgi:hypothetical protein
MLAGSVKPMSEKLKKYKLEEETGCWLWTGSVDKDGYGRMRGSIHGVVWSERAPRASYQEFKGTIENGLMVLHTCNTPACINPEHLYLGTHKENGEDMIKAGHAKGWSSIGEKNGMFGRTGVLNPMFGKKHSPDAIAKMSQPKPRRTA